MKAYGYNITRAGRRVRSHACCDLRNGCEAPAHRRKSRWRCMKRRARAEGKREAVTP